MKKKDHRFYYLKNKKYSEFLETQTKSSFQKYIDFISEYNKKGGSFLDIGCGTGIVLNALSGKGKMYGLEIAETSVKKCKEKGLKCSLYDGKNFPLKDKSFNIVGSYNVLEHVDDTELFLNENLRVLDSGGYLFIICPNFLSITNNFHYHTTGLLQKFKNIATIFKDFFLIPQRIGKMEPVVRKQFMPDDDAVNITNPVFLLFWAKRNNLSLKYWSSQSVYRSDVVKYLDKSILKFFFGSTFMIFQKT